MNNYLSKRGYVIRKENFGEEELVKLKIQLRARPLVDTKFNIKKEDTSYPVYIETKNKLYIPKMFGISQFGFPNAVLENFEGKDWINESTFKGALLERQIKPAKALLDACIKDGGGILNLGTGSGKTFIGLYTLSQLKGKTIIVVNKIPLMNQWISEINRFLPGIKVGIIQGQNVDIEDIENCDIVVAMLQSMARIDYPDSMFKDFKVFLLDEAHNVSSKVFSQILFKLCCKYTIGLSATPKRSDGCEYVFKWHIGEIVYREVQQREGKQPVLRYIKVDSSDYKEIVVQNRFTGQKQIQFTSMLSDLIEMPKRNRLIIEVIKDIIKKDSSRKILVLSDRRNHIMEMKSLLEQQAEKGLISFTYGLFLGGMKQKELDKGRSCQIILATFQAFGEGVSEKDLDTLILTTPKKFIGHLKNSVKNESGKLEQIVGRIFRKDHTESNPLIVDINDHFSLYKTQTNSRKTFYKQHFQNAIVEEQSINLDDINTNTNDTNDTNDILSLLKTKKVKSRKELEKEKEKESQNTSNITNYCILE